MATWNDTTNAGASPTTYNDWLALGAPSRTRVSRTLPRFFARLAAPSRTRVSRTLPLFSRALLYLSCTKHVTLGDGTQKVCVVSFGTS